MVSAAASASLSLLAPTLAVEQWDRVVRRGLGLRLGERASGSRGYEAPNRPNRLTASGTRMRARGCAGARIKRGRSTVRWLGFSDRLRIGLSDQGSAHLTAG